MNLDERQKAWLVTAFACYKRSGEVLRDFAAEFGFNIPKNQASKYNLSDIRTDEQAKARGCRKWMPLWKESRQRFETGVMDIPIANKVYRIKKLDEMFECAYGNGSIQTAAGLLEQAAKEMGGAFSNARRLEGAIEHMHEHEHHIPDDVRDATLAESVRAAIAAALVQGRQGQTIQ